MADFGKERREKPKLRKAAELLLEDLERIKEEREEMLRNSIEVLNTGDENARWMAVGVLGETGDGRIVPSLVRLLESDHSPRVRAEAASILGDFRDMKESFTSLLEAMKDPSAIVREKALEALGGITAGRISEGRYESAGGIYIVCVEKPSGKKVTRLRFLSKTENKELPIRDRPFFLIGATGYIEGKTDDRGWAVLNNRKLTDSGCDLNKDRITFVLR